MKRPHDVSAQRRQTLDRVLELVVLLGDDMTRSLAADGLTVARAHVLWLLHHGGPTTQRAVADALKVSPRNVTGLVDGLAATGFVTREPHPSDRRAVLVSLTERGAATVAGMDAGHQQLADLLFGEMSAGQLQGFADGLEHVVGRLHQELAAGGEGGR